MATSRKGNVDSVSVAKQHKEIKDRLHFYFQNFQDLCIKISHKFLLKKGREIAEELGYELEFSSNGAEHKFLDHWKHTYFPENPFCFSYGPEIVDIEDVPSEWDESGGYTLYILNKVVGRYYYRKQHCKQGFPRTWDEWVGPRSFVSSTPPDFRKIGTIEFVMETSEIFDLGKYNGFEIQQQKQKNAPVAQRSKPAPAAPFRAPSERVLKRRRAIDGGATVSNVDDVDVSLDFDSQMDILDRSLSPEITPAPEIVVQVDDAVPGTSAVCQRRLAVARQNPLYAIDTNSGAGTSASIIVPTERNIKTGNGALHGCKPVEPKRQTRGRRKKTSKENIPVAQVGPGSSPGFIRPKRKPLKHPGKSIPDIRHYNKYMTEKEERAAAKELENGLQRAVATSKAAEEKMTRQAAAMEGAELENESATPTAAGDATENQNSPLISPFSVESMDEIEVGRGLLSSPSSISGLTDIVMNYDSIFDDTRSMFSLLSMSSVSSIPSTPGSNCPQRTPTQTNFIPPPCSSTSSVIIIDEVLNSEMEEQRRLMPPPTSVSTPRSSRAPSTICLSDDEEEEIVPFVSPWIARTPSTINLGDDEDEETEVITLD